MRLLTYHTFTTRNARKSTQYERIDGREGVKETAYLMALLGVEGVAEKWASL